MKTDNIGNKMIYFITSNPEHPTNIEIIKELDAIKDEFSYKVVDSSRSLEFLKKEFNEGKILKGSVWLIKPDHPQIYKFCKISSQYDIRLINRPSLTVKFRNRWKIEESVKIILERQKEHDVETLKKLLIPESIFLKSPSNFSSVEFRNYLKEIKTKIQNLMPLIVKHPINHDGFHQAKA